MGSESIFSKICGNGSQKADLSKIQEQNEGLLRGPQSDGYMMYLNKGQDDEMQFCCYKRSTLKTAIVYLSFVLTGGILRLIFHWIPHWFLLATSEKCKINEAEMLLITEIYNKNHKIYHVKPLKVLTPENVAKLRNDDNLLNHHHVLVSESPPALSVHFENGHFRDLDKLLMFSCKKVTYIWDNEKQEFVKLVGLDRGVSCEIFHKYKPLSPSEQFMRRLVYGPNKIVVKELSICTLLCLEVLNPFYIFQILSFILWFADDYYYYAATIMLMAMGGISMSVMQTRKNQRNLRSTCHSSDVCTVLRRMPKSNLNEVDMAYKSETISTEYLVPGDILEIPSHGCVMYCDALLLTGNCILNESMLTGESVPVTKTALPNVSSAAYDPKEHARHTLFCGTHVIQTRYFGNEKVLAVVVRTGFSTAKGNLVRSILYPPPVDFRFEKDSYRFVTLLGFIAFIGFIYTVVTKVMRGVHARDLILEACDLITIVVPPALPAAMTVGRFYAQIRLKRKEIFCISPRTINVSGSINCVCFDKTGTLTEDGLDLLCVVPIEEKGFRMPVKNVESLPYNLFVYGLVSCHSLTIIDKQIVGDPLDLKMFESTKWVMEEHDVADNNKFNMIFPTVLKPPKNRPSSQQNLEGLQIGIIREFPFSSSSQRMGVIVRRLNGTHFEYYCKGSPEMILNFVRKASVPDDFLDVLESYTQEGYRVIALAHKELKLSYAKVQKVQRESIEKDMDLLGLIVLENRLKPDTTPCIQALNDANIRVIMVTGDNILTALSVAKDCDIVTPCQSIITVNVDNSHPPNLYYTLTNTKSKQLPTDLSVLTNSASVMSLDTIESQVQTITNSSMVKADPKRPSLMFNNYRFAMTGRVWGVVKEYYPELLPRLCTRGNIFARMGPDQKQQLIQELQSLGYCVAMCGDGANDCGALKAAHAGISLSEAESSVASPFTSKTPNITCVLNVIREGRAALVTSFGIFKYMAAYSLCQFISVLLLYSIESNLTDMEFLYIDLAMISIFTFFFGRTEPYQGKLVKETPLSSLMSVSPILSLLLQIFLVGVFQVASFEHLKSEPWYVPFNSTEEEDVACVENYTLYTVSSFQYIILAVVFSKGPPYRKNIFTNFGFVLSTMVMTAISIYLALSPAQFLIDQFELVLPEDFNFRLFMLVYAGVNFVLSLLVEHLLIEQLIFKKLRFKFHKVDKSKRKYLAVERDLNRDTKWPSLTSDFKSAASPMNPLPICTAEIVIEKENKFDKNHVLNKLYENSDSPSRASLYSQKANNTSALNSPDHQKFGLNFAPGSPNVQPQFQVNGVVHNETGYFSQEDLLFSSLPSESLTSQSETFKSLSNNTNYDLASSHLNIAELPYDSVNHSPVVSPVKVLNSRHDVENDGSLSNFNSFGRSPPQNVEKLKSVEMNVLDTNR
ncbi:probable cation-transporting ATPase 13A3 [Anoplophora glabripennis]|uniref:probable cation-transporting ATPase 13A3 n=1 Tax=Anoplophora glabripennis TaxID=217634 RepID=UPI0008739A60|nr:probable cation-transporting ATPase 13A3 [Anoplophora glabripennis]